MIATDEGGVREARHRPFVALVRRQAWIVVQAVIVVGGLAVLLEQRTPTVYEATAEVLPDRSHAAVSPVVRDPFLGAEVDALTSDEVVAAAGAVLGRTVGPVQAEYDSVVLLVTVSGPDAGAAEEDADAVADAYLDRRREEAGSELEAVRTELVQEQADIEARLQALTGQEAVDPDVELRRAALRAELQDNLDAQRELELRDVDGATGEITAQATSVEVDGPEAVQAGAAGALLGLVLGLVVVSVRVRVDDQVRTAEQASSLDEQVELAGVVGLSALEEVVDDRGSWDDPVPDDVRALLVVLAGGGEGPRTLLVTAPDELWSARALAVAIERAVAEGDGPTLVVRCVVPGSAAATLELARSADVVVVALHGGVTQVSGARRLLRSLHRVHARTHLVLLS
jgi:soluble P-type ATPase